MKKKKMNKRESSILFPLADTLMIDDLAFNVIIIQ